MPGRLRRSTPRALALRGRFRRLQWYASERVDSAVRRVRRPTKPGGKRPQDKPRQRARLRPCRTATAAPRAGRRTALLGRARRCEQDAYSGGHGPARGQRRLRAQSQEKNRGACGGASSAIPPIPPRRPDHAGASPSRPAPATGRAGRLVCHEAARCGNVGCGAAAEQSRAGPQGVRWRRRPSHWRMAG